jgi:flagellar biosynthesis/type III secretory pathway protein FliH
MLAGEWDLNEALRVREEESLEKGLKIGRKEGLEEGVEKGWEKGRDVVFNVMSRAKSMDELREMLEASFSQQSVRRG